MPIFSLVAIPLFISFAHFIGLHRKIHNPRLVLPLRSFSAGFSIGYVFLFVLPETFRLSHNSFQTSLVWMLIGFVVFHSLLKFVFRTRNVRQKVMLIDEIHLTIAAIYNFLLTFSIVEISKQSVFRSLFLVTVVILHTTLSEISHKELRKSTLKYLKTPALIFSTMLGGLLPLFNIATSQTLAILYALAAGAIIYITTREELPSESEGDTTYFMLGALICIISATYIL